MATNCVVITLPPDALPGLREVAHQEYRSPQAQAAWLVLEGLRQRGVLAPPTAEVQEPPSAA